MKEVNDTNTSETKNIEDHVNVTKKRIGKFERIFWITIAVIAIVWIYKY